MSQHEMAILVADGDNIEIFFFPVYRLMKRKICLNVVENKEADYCAGGKKSFVISASRRPILASVSSRWERGHGVAYYTAAHYSREPQLLLSRNIRTHCHYQ